MTDFHIILTPGEGGLSAASALHYAALAGLRFAALILPWEENGFSALAKTAKLVRTYSLYANVEARTGVELCHVPPALIPSAVQEARAAGAELVLVHGETLCDQVEAGTNLAAIEAGADILAHPGLIDAEAAAFAAEKGVALEFTSCPKHGLTNAHTAAMALRFGCPLVRGSAARRAEEITTRAFWPFVIKGADVFTPEKYKVNLLELLRESEENLIKKLMKA
ncbi:histidinol phosphate phosphatase domain-containing protein [Mailhella massiliensis]|uniref:Histidinol phosphate phosphatase domain-containing protein n=1 Tax=Mailhella massiliensis TaxID=1903261 RepID=A0A921AVZ3_9BACT|nr:histidinol phosphate phosphatase domain-containing protein [Mailhella massiliensis]HJD96763.1 histidinol phosphate phosphatase domain-containing protein [Mailhella massiliensis]